MLVLYAILAAAGAVLLPLLVPAVSFWWAPLLFLGFHVGLSVLHIAFTAIVALIFRNQPPPQTVRPFFHFWMAETNRLIAWFARVRLHVSGTELLPKDQRFLLVSNHLSRFDPMLCLWAFHRQPVSYISKPSNFRIPVAGVFMRQCRFLSIDRESSRNALVTIREAADMIASGALSVGIYPEGTRSKTGRLQPFRCGAFKIALYAHAPIVVVTMKGTDHIAKNAPFKATQVQILVRAVIPYEEIEGLPTADIAARVRAIMLEPAGNATLFE